jgi:hypothetical protein
VRQKYTRKSNTITGFGTDWRISLEFHAEA